MVFGTAGLAAAAAGTDSKAVCLEGKRHTSTALIARMLRGGGTVAKPLSNLFSAGALVVYGCFFKSSGAHVYRLVGTCV